MSRAYRTHECGKLTRDDDGQRVTLCGWANRVRDLGSLLFVDLRDRTGVAQLFLDPEKFADRAALRPESCLRVEGTVRLRSPETVNPKMATGEVELVVEEFEVLGPSKALPFPVSDEEQMRSVNEELRVRHRYLDLRRPSMQRKLAVRAAIVREIRSFLDERGFLEIETPIITRSTPEGARDYLVPYRLQPGLWYALPQSPQQYKQLLMVAGLERYYQIAKCFRDESQRADRQPEFTQLDLEMSFVSQEDVLQLAEELTTAVCNRVIEQLELDKEPVQPFERLRYDDSMELYGTDKPDLRFGLPIFDVTEVAGGCGFGVFRTVVESGGCVRGVVYPGGAELSRKQIGELEEFAKEFGAKGLASLPLSGGEGSVQSASGIPARGIAKFLRPEEIDSIVAAAGAKEGDLLCFVADRRAVALEVLGRLRNEIGKRCGLRDPRILKFCWIVDFPLFEKDEETGGWTPSHHPFTGPKSEHLEFLESDPGKVRAECYDIVCNGTEWASGSIRIHRPDIQSRVFSVIGIDEETQKERFGHMLEAFEFGAPPHGGIAPGIDRLAMMLCDEENIREVIAFPKVGQGLDPLMGAPSEIDNAQWNELGIRLKK